MSIMAIIVSLVLLMFFAYRGYTVILLAPLMAVLAVLLSGDAGEMLPTYTQIFMRELGEYLIKFFPLFLMGALFGKLMSDSGAAHSIATWVTRKIGSRHAILTVVVACAILTYGGVSLFVVAFAVFPIAAVLFRTTDTPKRLIPPAIALGSFTFTMTALPGTPSIQNAIPIPFFGTNSFAAPGLGMIAAVIMFGFGMWWLQRSAGRAKVAQEGYGDHKNEELGHVTHEIPFFRAITPIIIAIGINGLLTYFVFPAVDLSWLNQKRYGFVQPSAVIGLWSILIALLCASLWIIAANRGAWDDLKESINSGCRSSLFPMISTGSEVGYGAVIASLAGFALIRDAVLNLSPSNPLISEAVAMNVLAGITASSSGGMSIALRTLGADYLAMANAAGISPELLHRVATIAAGGLDTLPHSAAVITLLLIGKLTHRQCYPNIMMVTVVGPILALWAIIALGTVFGSF